MICSNRKTCFRNISMRLNSNRYWISSHCQFYNGYSMISEWWSCKSCSSDVESVNLEWETEACLYSQSTATSHYQSLEFAFILQREQFTSSEVESNLRLFLFTISFQSTVLELFSPNNDAYSWSCLFLMVTLSWSCLLSHDAYKRSPLTVECGETVSSGVMDSPQSLAFNSPVIVGALDVGAAESNLWQTLLPTASAAIGCVR